MSTALLSASSASHRALLVPELLENILTYNTKIENSLTVCVCSWWADVAAKQIWRSLDGADEFRRLLVILSPVSTTKSSDAFVFDEYLDGDGWYRFQRYSHLVLSLCLDGAEVFRDLLREIAETRPCLNLFPNLRTLTREDSTPDEWDFKHYLLFMHPNIHRLSVNIDISLTSSAYQFIDALSRIPKLVHLEILSTDTKVSESHIIDVIKEFTCLETVVLPYGHISWHAITKLASRPRLRELITRDTVPYSCCCVQNTKFRPRFLDNAYPSLRKLAFTATAMDAIRFLQHPYFPSGLESLKLEMSSQESSLTIRTLLETVAENCGQIQELWFRDVGEDPQSTILREDRNFPLIDFTSFYCLTTLKILHQHMLPWSNADIMELGSTLPLVENLYLNAEPLESQDPDEVYPALTLTLAVLPILAHVCPRLRTLAVAFTTDPVPLYTWPVTIHLALDSLHVGVSQIDSENVRKVTQFLARIMVPRCQIILPTFVSSATPFWREVSQELPDLQRLKEFGIDLGVQLERVSPGKNQ
ncbi:hypothetical protein Hypma_012592 [Hypsizygus marmoreus]|uniref:F-box domain-containing protein n=1 Tax=Hypsizygus marmoreus TaxID=39966 RepID=A0A369JNG9_HYPMA|nr:hypothetical protein Hypma_012592 [Hypsizygus marmoreus]